jgi:Ni,Fe-hydrogenase III component G
MMNEEEKWAEINRRLDSLIDEVEQRKARRGIIRIAPHNLVQVARILFSELGGRLATATGIHVRDGIQVLYHFCFDANNLVVSVKTLARGPAPTLDSITPFIPAAGFIEREIHDLLGAEFRGHPQMERLILADDWPEGVHPLRKDFDSSSQNPSSFEGVSEDAPGRGK